MKSLKLFKNQKILRTKRYRKNVDEAYDNLDQIVTIYTGS